MVCRESFIWRQLNHLELILMNIGIPATRSFVSVIPRKSTQKKKRWHDILSRISFLLRETVDWKCTKSNPYEEEYSKVKLNDPEYEEIRRRYYEEDSKLEEYRDQCKKEAVELLLKWSHYMET